MSSSTSGCGPLMGAANNVPPLLVIACIHVLATHTRDHLLIRKFQIVIIKIAIYVKLKKCFTEIFVIFLLWLRGWFDGFCKRVETFSGH